VANEVGGVGVVGGMEKGVIFTSRCMGLGGDVILQHREGKRRRGADAVRGRANRSDTGIATTTLVVC
jgi:hypothetical protein